MPIYEYFCQNCKTTHERVFKMAEFPQEIECECGKRAKKILSSSGAVFTDNDVKWLESASKVLVRHHERPITTRTEYRKYLKDNKLAPIG